MEKLRKSCYTYNVLVFKEAYMSKQRPGKAKQGFSRIVFSRMGLILLLILFQLGFFVVTTSILEGYTLFVQGALRVLGVVVLIYIINAEENPAFKMTWILCVMAFPTAGTLLYIYAKNQVGVSWMGKRLATLKMETDPFMEQDMDVVDALRASKPANANLAYYLSHQLGFPTYRNTEIAYLPLGEDKLEAMAEELEKAKRFIFMEYFIVRKSYMWSRILDILERKAEEGVEVRFMYDGTCAISMLPYDYPKELEKKGIRCKMMNPIKPFLSTVQNNRDHRKICVIDGKVGITGGINIGDEYINRKSRFGHWKDTSIMLKGDAVQSLTILFLQMWNVDEKEPERYEKYVTTPKEGVRRELGYVLPYGDSPFDNENVGEEVYFHILNHAKKYVHIMTPYLILDNEMITTLTRAAKSNIEVKIIMPGIPDKWYAFAVAKTYYRELIKAGVQIYEYTPGFVHAKVFVSDDDTATVGTINLDYRSLYLHFECGVFVYNNSAIGKIEEDFQQTLAKCHKVTLLEVRNRTMLTKIMGQVLRLVAPLM